MAGWCDEGAVVRFPAPLDALGDWRGAHARLLTEGTPTPVRRPSPEQLARAWAPPRHHRLADLVVDAPRRLQIDDR